MNYTIAGDNDCPLIQIRLREDETVRIERGCMAYMSDVRLEGKSRIPPKRGSAGCSARSADR